MLFKKIEDSLLINIIVLFIMVLYVLAIIEDFVGYVYSGVLNIDLPE